MPSGLILHPYSSHALTRAFEQSVQDVVFLLDLGDRIDIMTRALRNCPDGVLFLRIDNLAC